MSNGEKLAMVKAIMEISADDVSSDGLISAYLTLAQKEILAWRYSYSADWDLYNEVPAEYETTQIFAVVAGFSQGGAEGQTQHGENGIQRTFKYADMVAYIRAHVIPIVKVT